jgi:acetolactate synthase-1/2/3 large subunit
MGFSIPAAVGAYFATGMPSLVITSDGSFNMNSRELLTAIEYKVPLTVAILNNGSLGMISRMKGGKDVSSVPPADYASLAKAYGAEGITVDNIQQLQQALQAKHTLPLVLDIKVQQ